MGPLLDTDQLSELRRSQALFAEETLEGALRQLALYGLGGVPVVSDDRARLVGSIVVAVASRRRTVVVERDVTVHRGDRVVALVPRAPREPTTEEVPAKEP